MAAHRKLSAQHPARRGWAGESLSGLPCLGRWVQAGTRREPIVGIVVALHADDPDLVPDAAAVADFDAQLDAPGWLAEADQAAALQEKYAVRWEGSASPVDVYTEADVREACLPCTAAGNPLFAKVLHGAREGELGLVVAATGKTVSLRFLMEYEEEEGRVVSAEGRHRALRGYRLFENGTGALRIELYEYKGGVRPGLVDIDAFLTSVFLELELQTVCAEWPMHRDAACLLLDPDMTRAAAVQFAGAKILHETNKGDFVGIIGEPARSVLGDWEFRVEFPADGDYTHMRSCELLERIDWSSFQRQEGDRPATPLVPGPLSRTPPQRPRAQGGGELASPSPQTAAQRLAAARERVRRRRERADAGADPGAGGAALAHGIVQPPAPVPRAARRARFMSQHTMNDLVDHVLEGQDTRYSREWQQANPARPRTLDRAEEFADAGWGPQRKRVADFAPRWQKFSAEVSSRLLGIVDRFAAVKASSLSTYTSSRAGYEQFCAAMVPPLVAYPLLARNVGAWLLARWMKPRKSNLSNLKPLVSALTNHTVHTLELSLDVRPYPGMAHLERRRLGRIMIAIAEMEDLALRRSIPLTLHLLRLSVQERVVDLPPSHAERWTVSQARAVRDVAMYGVARVCMLRKDDMTQGKLRVAVYRSRNERLDVQRDGTCNNGRLLVAPGKSHRTDVWAEVPGAPDAELHGDWRDWMLPGVAMERWLEHYRRASGGALAPDAPLFPMLSESGAPLSEPFDPKKLLEQVRRWATDLGFPEDFVERLTVHGFRSGGCTDAINSGKMTKEEIQKQGRWSGPTYEMYVHLAASVVRESLRNTVTTAMRTPAELRELASGAEGRRAAYLADLRG